MTSFPWSLPALLYFVFLFRLLKKKKNPAQKKKKKSLFLVHRILFYNKYIFMLLLLLLSHFSRVRLCVRDKVEKVESSHEKLCVKNYFFSSLNNKIFHFRWSNSGWKTFMNFYIWDRKWIMWEKKQEREKRHLKRRNLKIQM